MTENKKFLICTDEMGVALIGRICPGVQFLPVEGMNLESAPEYQLLVSPSSKPKDDEIILEPDVGIPHHLRDEEPPPEAV